MSNDKTFEAFLVPESSVYQMQPGEYEIQSNTASLSSGGPVVVQAGYGEVLGDRLLIHEPSDVWLPEGATLFAIVPSIMSLLKKPVAKPFQIVITPMSGNRGTNFRVSVLGTKGDRKVLIKVTKKYWGRANDPQLAATEGEGTTMFTGDELIRDMKLKPGTHTMYIYGQEKSWGIDRYTKSVPIAITVSGTAAAAADATFRLDARPTKGDTSTRFLFLIHNAKAGREVWLRMSKPLWGRANDPIIAKVKGRGAGTSTPVYVSGSIIAGKADKPAGSISEIMVYADEKYLGLDRYSKSIPITFKTSVPSPTAVEHGVGEFKIEISPTTGWLSGNFGIRVINPPKGTREIRICTSKPGYLGREDDPVFARLMGAGFKSVTGGTMLYKRELDPTVQNVVYVYARADIPKTLFNPLGIDKYTPSVAVTLLPTPTAAPTPAPTPRPAPTPTPKPSPCREGYRRGKVTCPDRSVIYREVCRNGRWVTSGAICPEEGVGPVPTPTPEPGVCSGGAYSADGTMVCRDGAWVSVETEPMRTITPEEAGRRIKLGLPCFVKSTLPVIAALPGIPYIDWLPMLPFCRITNRS